MPDALTLPELVTRAAPLAPTTVNDETRTVSAVIATETPVLRRSKDGRTLRTAYAAAPSGIRAAARVAAADAAEGDDVAVASLSRAHPPEGGATSSR